MTNLTILAMYLRSVMVYHPINSEEREDES